MGAWGLQTLIIRLPLYPGEVIYQEEVCLPHFLSLAVKSWGMQFQESSLEAGTSS